jgi:hypothetical protein
MDSQSTTPESQHTTMSDLTQCDTQDDSTPAMLTNLVPVKGKGKKRAAVHEHIEELVVEGITQFICLKCKRLGRTKVWKRCHTTALRNHMEKHKFDNRQDHVGNLYNNIMDANDEDHDRGPDWEAFDETQDKKAREITVALCNMIIGC